MEEKICCMFEGKNATLAVRNRDLERIAVYWESSRTEKYLYRCRRCGRLVYYSCEEIANLYGGWDNADIFEDYIPVVGEVKDAGDGEEVKKALTLRRTIHGHNMEEDALSSYSYEFVDRREETET